MNHNPSTANLLALAARAGMAHNNGAGGELVLCATPAQLDRFAEAIAGSPNVGPIGAEAVLGIIEKHRAAWVFLSPEELGELARDIAAAAGIAAGAAPPPPAPSAPLSDHEIRAICLQHGFALRDQPDGRADLNPYVYTAIRAVLEAERQRREGPPR
jgi:hypothetical protein